MKTQKNRIILITGVSGGLGQKFAEYFLAKDYVVLGCSRSVPQSGSHGIKNYRTDVTNNTAVRSMMADIRQIYGGLDGLINSAGATSMNFLATTPAQTILNIVNTNILGTVYCCQEAIKIMQPLKRGFIINISSIHTTNVIPGSTLYAASKAFIEQFTRVLAQEVIASGVRVNALRLSFVEDIGMAKRVASQIKAPFKENRLSQVLGCLENLIHQDNKTITGQIIDP